ncbi:single-stranded DNA-binding protein [Cuneatibacter sp. NSJ-177]|uniref:single-stranded DNA-binding protein n=1 Tax=Cuneatibacter sp. NSJ-177 TaxID=2931401 RepID=UPI001FD5EBC9|nr:single-stranded DNA-binding protein [Cuneatibacter sp. NSJ-177]MCJ7837469.1 single-stranded DNA-binding protein [Cuneatibacter sp. NSJ-177]
MNKLFLMGRLTRDPEIRYGQGENQAAVARFSLAVDRRFKRASDTANADFFSCTAFGKQAEFVEKYLKQGTKILLTGRIQNNNYTDKNGTMVYSFQVIAEEIEFAESKKADSGGVLEDDDQRREQYHGFATGPDRFMNVPDGFDDDKLPFD